jgi:uncharacterized membrane protein
MVNREKIFLQIKLASYDKKLGKNDKRISEYYLKDYIYKSNLLNRVYCIIGFTMMFLLFNLRVIMDMKNYINPGYIFRIFAPWVLGTILIPMICTIIGNRFYKIKYNLAQKRLKNYYYLLECLDDLDNIDK